MENMGKKPRRSFTTEFKAEIAVCASAGTGRSVKSPKTST
jgi:hypothetical protein